MQLTSAQNGAAPRPAGMKQQAVKIVQKTTEVLVVRVSKTFASKELWESFEKALQKCIVQWLADRHVNALDSFAWKAEKRELRASLYRWCGCSSLRLKPSSNASGQDGIFLDLSGPCKSRAGSSG